MSTDTDATVADLSAVEGKAEIVEGKIVMMSPTGGKPGRAALAICSSLREFESKAEGFAYPDNVGFVVDLPNRKSFSPDAAFSKVMPEMDFVQGAPEFAVEVRSENDYGTGVEQRTDAKRADYFAAGTKVVWDVDLLNDDVVRVYRADKPTESVIYRNGDQAEAEPAVPGWRFPVNELFE